MFSDREVGDLGEIHLYSESMEIVSLVSKDLPRRWIQPILINYFNFFVRVVLGRSTL